MFSCLVIADSDPSTVFWTGLLKAFHHGAPNHSRPSTSRSVDFDLSLIDDAVLFKLLPQKLTLSIPTDHDYGGDGNSGGRNLLGNQQSDPLDARLEERDNISSCDRDELVEYTKLMVVGKAMHRHIEVVVAGYKPMVDSIFHLQILLV